MNVMALNLADLVKGLVPVASEAGRVIMEVYARDVAASQKTDGSPVTEADERAEAIILAALGRIAPGIPVVSEESAESHSRDHGGPFFLVDPLDGTKEFLKRDGKGSFTVNIALVDNGVPIMGVVYAPALGRMFSGVFGRAAQEERANGAIVPLSVREPQSGALVAVASASHRDAETDAWLQDRGIQQTVSIGSSLKFCLVAAGEADVYPRFGTTMEWDTAAGDAILRAAGGMTATPEGTTFRYGKPGYRNGSFVAWGGGRR